MAAPFRFFARVFRAGCPKTPGREQIREASIELREPGPVGSAAGGMEESPVYRKIAGLGPLWAPRRGVRSARIAPKTTAIEFSLNFDISKCPRKIYNSKKKIFSRTFYFENFFSKIENFEIMGNRKKFGFFPVFFAAKVKWRHPHVDFGSRHSRWVFWAAL